MKEGGVTWLTPPSFFCHACSDFSDAPCLTSIWADITSTGAILTYEINRATTAISPVVVGRSGKYVFVSILIRLLPVGLEDIYVVNPDPVGRAKEISDLGLDLNPFAFYFRWLSGFFAEISVRTFIQAQLWNPSPNTSRELYPSHFNSLCMYK